MSVVVRAPSTGQVRIYCKGAESVLLPRLRQQPQPHHQQPLHQQPQPSLHQPPLHHHQPIPKGLQQHEHEHEPQGHELHDGHGHGHEHEHHLQQKKEQEKEEGKKKRNNLLRSGKKEKTRGGEEQEEEEMESEADIVKRTERHINYYATQGLRTLVIARAVLDKTKFRKWFKVYERASLAVQHRKTKVPKK
ncbi:hypothetical protein HMI54_009573 [Coelomomyces lativittatus]|nr:hypothetical protein HMI54_009573 [Coelomomyces lativittatus]